MTYGTFSFPNPAGTGFGDYTGYELVAAWGVPFSKLIGADDATGSNGGAGYFKLTKFIAQASGYVTHFKIKSGASGNVKVAIYEDNGGSPGDLKTAMNTGQPVTAGQWNTLSFTSTDLTEGTSYWLAYIADTTGAGQFHTGGGSMKYKGGMTYGTFSFPNPAGTGFGAYTGYELVAGWGIP